MQCSANYWSRGWWLLVWFRHCYSVQMTNEPCPAEMNTTDSFTYWLVWLILLLDSNPLLCLPKGLLPSDFTTKILYTFLISTTRVTSTLHRILLVIQWIILSTNSSLCNFFKPYVFVLFFSVSEAMYASLFSGMNVDIRTFTQLIFLSPYMTQQVTFDRTLTTRRPGRGVSVIKYTPTT